MIFQHDRIPLNALPSLLPPNIRTDVQSSQNNSNARENTTAAWILFLVWIAHQRYLSANALQFVSNIQLVEYFPETIDRFHVALLVIPCVAYDGIIAVFIAIWGFRDPSISFVRLPNGHSGCFGVERTYTLPADVSTPFSRTKIIPRSDWGLRRI